MVFLPRVVLSGVEPGQHSTTHLAADCVTVSWRGMPYKLRPDNTTASHQLSPCLPCNAASYLSFSDQCFQFLRINFFSGLQLESECLGGGVATALLASQCLSQFKSGGCLSRTYRYAPQSTQ